MSNKTELQNLILAFRAKQIKHKDVLDIGKIMMSEGADELTNGGFWIWDAKHTKEFYSDIFIESLGFKKEEINYTPEFWMQQIFQEGLELAIIKLNEHKVTKGETPYHLVVKYYKKDVSIIEVLCSGQGVFDSDEMLFLIGSHKILE